MERLENMVKIKYILTVICILGITQFYAQEESNTTLFAQCLFAIDDQSEMLLIEEELRSHPNAKLVRLDFNTKRAFILTKNIESLSKDEFSSWFGDAQSTISCIQIGINGIDKIKRYPFANCED